MGQVQSKKSRRAKKGAARGKTRRAKRQRNQKGGASYEQVLRSLSEAGYTEAHSPSFLYKKAQEDWELSDRSEMYQSQSGQLAESAVVVAKAGNETVILYAGKDKELIDALEKDIQVSLYVSDKPLQYTATEDHDHAADTGHTVTHYLDIEGKNEEYGEFTFKPESDYFEQEDYRANRRGGLDQGKGEITFYSSSPQAAEPKAQVTNAIIYSKPGESLVVGESVVNDPELPEYDDDQENQYAAYEREEEERRQQAMAMDAMDAMDHDFDYGYEDYDMYGGKRKKKSGANRKTKSRRGKKKKRSTRKRR
jgi:hypothetical protein